MNTNSNNSNGSKTSEMAFSEAPASWNTRYISPEGFECQITLRGENGSELLEKVNNAIAYLLEHGCTPYAYRSTFRKTEEAKNGNGSNGTDTSPAWCPIHQCEMKRWEKDGQIWYSHKVDGQWCNGKG